MIDYYDILEVELDATQDQIKAQYRFLVQAWHPDKFVSAESKSKAEAKLKIINEAYGVLKDVVKREQFDSLRHVPISEFDQQAEVELEKRAQAARAAAEKRAQVVREKHEQEARDQRSAEEQVRKIAAERAQRESVMRQVRALNIQLAPGIVMEFVRVPAGEFSMGSDTFKDPDARKDEKPQHTILLAEYLIGQNPVTNRQYQVFLLASGHRQPLHWLNGIMPKDKENHPVVYVSWVDTVAFCSWLSKVIGMKVRLPSEAEWEKAARGVDGRIYPWGNQSPDGTLANYAASDTRAVSEYIRGASPYGALDMSGNVCEWVNDFYNKNYYQTSPATNPAGPVWGEYRVLRGGSFSSSVDLIRTASRFWALPSAAYEKFNGFRCAISL